MRTETNRYSDDFPPVAREGWVYIGSGLAITLAVWYTWDSFLTALPFLAGTLFVVWFFRDPRRISPAGENLLLAPADGTVLSVGQNRDDDHGGGVVICIFMSVFSVHVNRCPLTGVATSVTHHPGRFLSAFKSEAAQVNERNEVIFNGPHGKVKCVQIAGLVARRIVCRLSATDEVTAGQRYGMIKFGSRVDVHLPPAYRPMVRPGDKVRGALTIIAATEEVKE